jgi:hypothetical protein
MNGKREEVDFCADINEISNSLGNSENINNPRIILIDE